MGPAGEIQRLLVLAEPDPIAVQEEADRRVAAVVRDFISNTVAAYEAGNAAVPDRVAVMALAEALIVVRDDLVTRHGEAGRGASKSAIETTDAIMTSACRAA